MMMNATIRTQQTNSESDQNSLCSTFVKDHEVLKSNSTKYFTNPVLSKEPVLSEELVLSEEPSQNSETKANLKDRNSAFISNAEVSSNVTALISSHQAKFEACKRNLNELILAKKSTKIRKWPSVPESQKLENLTKEEFQDLNQIIDSSELECR